MSSPNVLVILTDQQRYDTIAALGSPLLMTPTLDRLCEEGTAFTRAYSPSPVCVPARHALATGQPPHISGVTDNYADAAPAPSFMQRLADAGYRTHGVGKMHFVPDPYEHWGFQTRDTSEEGGHDSKTDDYRRFLSDAGFGHVTDPYGMRSEFYYLPQPSQLPEAFHHSRWVADRSIDFLNEREAGRPFLLCSHFIGPHPPFASPLPWSRLYRAHEPSPPHRPEGYPDLLTYWNHAQNRYKWRDGGRDRFVEGAIQAAYFASISYIDRQVGRILDVLGDAAEDTLVIFSSDHGELLGDYGSYGKRCMLDSATRVPLIVRWPGRLGAGQCCGLPASLLDLYTTITTAAEIDGPAPHEDGTDLVALAAGDASREAVFSQFSHGGFGLHMAMTDRHKYVYSEPDRKEWFFVLQDDPPEAPQPLDDPRASQLRDRLINRYRQDGYLEPLNEQQDGWRVWPKRSISDDPHDGLLFQDPPNLQEDINALGPSYARLVTRDPDLSMKLLRPHETPPVADSAQQEMLSNELADDRSTHTDVDD